MPHPQTAEHYAATIAGTLDRYHRLTRPRSFREACELLTAAVADCARALALCDDQAAPWFRDKQQRAERLLAAAQLRHMRCQTGATCHDPATHIDNKGFLFCTHCGTARRRYKPCRKLRPHELNRLRRGQLIACY